MKTYLSEMRLRTERLTTHQSATDIRLVQQSLDTLYLRTEESIKQIEELYLGPPENVAELRDTLTELYAAQDDCLRFTSRKDITLSQIEEYEQYTLFPLYNRAEKQVETIIDVDQNRKLEYGEMAESIRQSTLFSSLLLVALIVGRTAHLFTADAAAAKARAGTAQSTV